MGTKYNYLQKSYEIKVAKKALEKKKNLDLMAVLPLSLSSQAPVFLKEHSLEAPWVAALEAPSDEEVSPEQLPPPNVSPMIDLLSGEVANEVGESMESMKAERPLAPQLDAMEA